MHGLFKKNQIKKPDLACFVPDFRFLIDDLIRVDDRTLKERKITVYSKLVLWALRDGRSADRFYESLKLYTEYMQELIYEQKDEEGLYTILSYLYIIRKESISELIDAIPSKMVQEKAMTIAERLEKEGIRKGRLLGWQEGMEKGRKEQLKRFMNKKFGPLDVSQRVLIDNADSESLDIMWDNTIIAESIEEVLKIDS